MRGTEINVLKGAARRSAEAPSPAMDSEGPNEIKGDRLEGGG